MNCRLSQSTTYYVKFSIQGVAISLSYDSEREMNSESIKSLLSYHIEAITIFNNPDEIIFYASTGANTGCLGRVFSVKFDDNIIKLMNGLHVDDQDTINNIISYLIDKEDEV